MVYAAPHMSHDRPPKSLATRPINLMIKMLDTNWGFSQVNLYQYVCQKVTYEILEF